MKDHWGLDCDGFVDPATGPREDCFACASLTLAETCSVMGREGQTHPLRVIDCHDYRQGSDPHDTCRCFRLAPADVLAGRLRRWKATS